VFLCVSTYTAPLAVLDAAREDHKAWLDGLEAQDRVVLAGRQEPPVGGVIVLRAADRAELDGLLGGDPYAARGLATYTVTAFTSLRGAATG